MNRKHFILVLLIMICLYSFSQPTAKWVVNVGTPAGEAPQKITSDYLGNSYVCGSYGGSLVICADTLPQVIQPPTSNQTANLWITKYDSLGNCIWVRKGISSILMSNSGAIGAAFGDLKYYKGYLYCCGVFTDKMIFGNDTLHNPACSTSCTSSFIIKFDSLGNMIWNKCFKGNTSFSAVSELAPFDGGVFVVGTYQKNIVVDTVQLNTPNTWVYSGYVLKLNNAGKCKWGFNTGYSYVGTTAEDIVYDKNKHFYVSGTYGDSVVFPTVTLDDNMALWMGATMFLKYDTTGNFIWAKGGMKNLKGFFYGQAISMNGGNLFFTATYSDSARFGSTTFTITSGDYRDVIAKIDTSASGNFLWAKSTGNKNGGANYPSAICANPTGFVLHSTFRDSVKIGSATFYSLGSLDYLLTQYDPNGIPLWCKSYGGGGQEAGPSVHCNKNNTFIGGHSYSNYTLDGFSLTHKGWGDILFAKLNFVPLSTFIYSTKDNNFVSVFPNPNNGAFKINMTSSFSESIIHIYNSLGQIVFSQKILKGENFITMPPVAKGIYHYIIIDQSNTRYTGKLAIN